MRTSATHKAEGATPTPFQKPTLASLGCPPITISPSPGGFQAMVYEAICPRFDSWLGDSFARTFLHTPSSWRIPGTSLRSSLVRFDS